MRGRGVGADSLHGPAQKAARYARRQKTVEVKRNPPPGAGTMCAVPQTQTPSHRPGVALGVTCAKIVLDGCGWSSTIAGRARANAHNPT
jgi:hypothetical protein